MIARRGVLTGAVAALLGASRPWEPARAADATETFERTLADIEATSGGLLGVALLDTASGVLLGHRADERFPMCSTWKALAAAAILARVDAGRERLDRRVRFAAADLVDYSPITRAHAGGDGLTLAALCEAAVTVSDNTAANLLLDALGGPAAMTAFARSLGDGTTRLDRTEPTLNTADPGDPRDTTTPAAMAGSLRALLFGTALSAPSRARLTAWLLGNTTGDARLRAGLPKAWRVGDKTGSGDRGTTNDAAVVWPSAHPPVVVAAFLTGSDAPRPEREATLAAVGRTVAAALGR